MSKKPRKRGWGPSGSSISAKDASGYRPKIDPEIQIRNKLNYKLPPPKRLDDEEAISIEQFVDTWIDQKPIEGEKPEYATLSIAEFTEILSNPATVQKRLSRTMKERHAQMMEYFGKIDERAWVRDQIDLLKILEDTNMEKRVKVYQSWQKVYISKVQKALRVVRKKYPEKTEAFIEAAHAYLTSMEPKKPSPFAIIIRNRARELLLKGDFTGFRDFSDEWRMITSSFKKKREDRGE